MNNVVQLEGNSIRSLPSNVEAERALLGSLFMRNSGFDGIADFLRPHHFFDSANGAVFAKICEFVSKGLKADPVTLKSTADMAGPIKEAGGAAFLASLCVAAPTYMNTAEYGRIIHDAFMRRELISLMAQATHDAFDGMGAASEQIENMEERLYALSGEQQETALIDIAEATEIAIANADAAFRADGKVVGVPTGLADLDHKLGGLHNSDLVILAGRPSMGKSGLALTIGFNAAKAGKHVAYFSLEMGAVQLATRTLAHTTNVDSHKMRNGRLSGPDFQAMNRGYEDLRTLPIHINEHSSPSVQQIRTSCRRLKRKNQLDLIVVDYLQLITPSRMGSQENRVQEVSGISRGLKAIARDLNVPVLALSQLSRNVEQREDKRPQLSDLRESGSIEQDADVVMFVYRDEYYAERAGKTCAPELENVAEINIAKQRHGPIGGVTAYFEKKSAWFGDLQRGSHQNR